MSTKRVRVSHPIGSRIQLRPYHARCLRLPKIIYIDRAKYDPKFMGGIKLRVSHPKLKRERWLAVTWCLPVPLEGELQMYKDFLLQRLKKPQ